MTWLLQASTRVSTANRQHLQQRPRLHRGMFFASSYCLASNRLSLHSLRARAVSLRQLCFLFINASPELHIYSALLCTLMLTHGFSPSLLTLSTIIPIPKGNHVNLNDSSNYRSITLSSIIGKLIDLIVINRYGDKLMSTSNQFSFKPKGSTFICTMLVKETISYYRANCNDVYGAFFDATKAFDRVRYDKLFDCLFDREVPGYLLGYYSLCILTIPLVCYGTAFIRIDSG
jgi:hypothetical protein